jgi:hypothetical protein
MTSTILPALSRRAASRPVEHMDAVLGAALALEDVPAFLRSGDHVIEAIFEGAPDLEGPSTPAGVN